ncbi:PREDICTED: prostate and testis expressed protein 4-like [Dipodomys ordii]|uniref:Prostate and testis expressed protein 4-like n=1 Tax=Dipodomys ordii TaxID=10020 RepID=A0A1S3EN58_DIPOR|nr:PREDICTED: prostate and testis expressed protein 4-like [Dipodomys ordii]
MDRLLFLMLPGVLLVLCQPHMEDPPQHSIMCTSCDEFVRKRCKKNLSRCEARYPDFACQSKEVYMQHMTGEYEYKYSILGCPDRCMEYVYISRWQKIIFNCCHENYCNGLPIQHNVQENPFWLKYFPNTTN